MADTVLPVNDQNGTSPMTPEQYKELCKKVRHYQLAKNKGKKKNKPVLKPRGKVTEIQKTYLVEETATDLDDIKDEPFSLDQRASQLYVKTGSERIKCVNTGKSIPVGGAAVYRVFL